MASSGTRAPTPRPPPERVSAVTMSAMQALSFGSRANVARPVVGLRARQTAATRPLLARAAQAASGKLTLYTNPRSRSQIVEWYAKELGVKYDVAELDMGA